MIDEIDIENELDLHGLSAYDEELDATTCLCGVRYLSYVEHEAEVIMRLVRRDQGGEDLAGKRLRKEINDLMIALEHEYKRYEKITTDLTTIELIVTSAIESRKPFYQPRQWSERHVADAIARVLKEDRDDD